MKKFFALAVLLLTACLMFFGCAHSPEEIPSTDNGGENQTQTQETTTMYITINGNKLEVTLEKNSATDALVDRLKKSDITYTANDYGDFEKVGALGFSLPTSNAQITTQAGDIVLYSGNRIVIFYGSNSWSYTKLGRINGYSAAELRTLLGAGSGSTHVVIGLK